MKLGLLDEEIGTNENESHEFLPRLSYCVLFVSFIPASWLSTLALQAFCCAIRSILPSGTYVVLYPFLCLSQLLLQISTEFFYKTALPCQRYK